MISLICPVLSVFPSRLASMRDKKFITECSVQYSVFSNPGQWSQTSGWLLRGSPDTEYRTLNTGLRHKLFRRDARIVPAETERVVHDRIDLHFARGVGHVIQIAFRVGDGIVGRGRHDVGLEG